MDMELYNGSDGTEQIYGININVMTELTFTAGINVISDNNIVWFCIF